MTQPTNMTVAEFVTLLRGHMNIMAIGLSGANPQVPPHIFVPALASALGQVLGEASASPDIQFTLSMRKNAVEAFTDAVRKTVPAPQPVATINAKAS